MLAYVFWHWKQPAVPDEVYRSDLQAFHRALAGVAPVGFRRSLVFALDAATASASWLPPGLTGYEDWYLLDGSCALDVLNETAVGQDCRDSHDRVAREAGGGVGGLYRWLFGMEEAAGARVAYWFARPAGTTYAGLENLLRRSLPPGVSCWCRQMTLGPTPEFCVQAPASLVLPSPLAGIRVSLELIWPGSVAT